MSITWLSLQRDSTRPGPSQSASQPQTKTIYKYSHPALPCPGRSRRDKTTIDFKWEPFIMSVINDVPPWVSTNRQPGLAIHLFVGQETVISLERQEKSWSPNCHISKHKNYKSSSPPFLAVELNHSQVFASDLEKSQFTMENLKNNFAAQISKVLGRKIALSHRHQVSRYIIVHSWLGYQSC